MTYKVKVELDPIADVDTYMVVREDSEFFPVSLQTHSLSQLKDMLDAAEEAIQNYEIEEYK